MSTWTYYKGFDEEPTEIEPCEGHFWRVSPEGRVETIHEDDTEWHPQETPWDETYVNARPVSLETLPRHIRELDT